VPKHNIHIALIIYENGLFSYIINSYNNIKGKILVANFFRNLTVGTYAPLVKVPYGSTVYNVELKLGFGVN
jgi:ribosomal protein L2